ncbi:MAG: hypothetical protein AB8G14_01180 [Ilumatobacter sp.]
MSHSSSESSAKARWAAVAIPAGWVVAGVLLLSTAVTRWFRSGPGSRFGGLELADSIRSGVVSPSWGVWVAAAVYILVGLGGVFIATATLRHPAVVIPRGVLCALCLAGFIAMGVRAIPPSNWSSGPTMASLSFALAVTLSAAQLLTHTRK